MTVNSAQAATTEGYPWNWPMPPDPGDLSRRLTARRAELRLSVSQVAWRAGVDPRYLAYLESFPGHPDAGTLRQLAAALCTTSAALLGAGLQSPPGGDQKKPGWGSGGLVSRLTSAECYDLLTPQGIGRIAFGAAAGTMVLPVNYVVTAGTIVVRTGSGSPIAAHGDGQVSFEVDHFDLELAQGWSVLVRGEAHRVLQPAELRNLSEDCDLRPWPAGQHDLFVRIVPSKVTGRRIATQ
jgi:transcriptional regulator with XRE-family HTH domain